MSQKLIITCDRCGLEESIPRGTSFVGAIHPLSVQVYGDMVSSDKHLFLKSMDVCETCKDTILADITLTTEPRTSSRKKR